MPRSGDIVKAIDFSPLASAQLADLINNLTTTGFQPTTPACELTFVAPTSGIVQFIMSEMLQADTVNERGSSDVEVRLTDMMGTVVRAASTSDGQGIRFDFPSITGIFTIWNGKRILSGLDPGTTYWAQLQHSTALIDLQDQNLTVLGII